jgi:intracellular sulfur oxidation DsrE/DsrF family protein
MKHSLKHSLKHSWAHRSIVRALFVVLMTMAASPAARAQQAPPLQDKPFAEHKIALQLSDNDVKKQALVISVAYNLLKAYDPDKVAIEVVAFGPGIDLLRAESANRKLVESLIAQGVRFDVCLNTVDTLERETGKRPDIIPAATPVQVGVGQILHLTENGYTLVRP